MDDPAKIKSVAVGKKLANAPVGEQVVISGISGRFPCSDNMEAFKENLFNKVDMVTSTNNRWDMVHPELPKRCGKIDHIEKFDAGFFGVHRKEADIMEPMFRCLMEHTIEAIYDAGVHPKELERTNTGVYIGTINSDCQSQLMRHDLPHENYALTGIMRFSLPHRISYALKLNGPSYVLDSACSSSLYALNQAYEDIRKGKVDAAIVGITVLNLHPVSTLQFARLGVLSPDGASKTFDDSANGYARAEMVSTILLQKSKDARRIYSTVMHSKANADGYKDEGITFPSAEQQKELLKEFYEECEVDPASVDFVEAHGTGTRVGDFEEIRPIDEIFCTGRSSYLPVGSVKSNMGHSEPGAGLCQIAKAIITLETGLIPPNLHFSKPRDGVDAFESGRIKIVTETTPLPGKSGLIAISSFGFGGANAHTLVRWNEKAKSMTLDDAPRLVCVTARTPEAVNSILDSLTPLNLEFVALLHQIFKYDTLAHRYRGYAIVSKTSGEIRKNLIKRHEKKPHFQLVFGGVHEGFLTMPKEFFVIPVAFDVFKKSEKVLSGINGQYSSILATVVMQIAIFEMLRSFDILPQETVGSSYGMFSKAYADGLLTLQQTLKGAYYAAKLVLDKNGGSFGVSNDLKNDLMGKEGSLDFKAYKKIQDIINDMKDFEESKGNSLDSGFVTLQLGSATTTTSNGFTLPQEGNSLIDFLDFIGRLHEIGFTPNCSKIYPETQFPVARGTPSISPLIRWDHQDDWFVMSYRNTGKSERYERTIGVNVKETEWNYVAGHVIDGRNLFPATGYLYIAWHTLASSTGKIIEDTEVVFENVRFNRATTLSKDGSVEFSVSIHKGTGYFEVVEGDTAVVTGGISLKKKLREEQFNENVELIFDEDEETVPREGDIYKELRLRGYNYSGLFKSIKQTDPHARKALVEWHGNWVAFMDNMLQLQILHVNSRELYVPVFIQRLTVDAKYHLKYASKHNDSLLPVFYYEQFNGLKSGGIEIRGLNASEIARKKPLGDPVLERYIFVPNETTLTLQESIRVNMQIVLENSYRIKVKVAELLEEDEPLMPLILDALGDQPLIQAEAVVLSEKTLELSNVKIENKPLKSVGEALVVVAKNLLQNPTEGCEVVPENGYLLSREALGSAIHAPNNLHVLTVHETPTELLVLLRKGQPATVSGFTEMTEDTAWLPRLQQLLRSENNVVIYSQNRPVNGILGLTNCIRKEAGGEACKCVLIQDKGVPAFNTDLEYYKQQVEKGFAINVLKDGKWGTYRHLLLKEKFVEEAQHSLVEFRTKGDLSSAKWVEGPLDTNASIDFDEDLVQVHYSSLNFKDVMTATGRIQYSTSSIFERNFQQGMEYSGIDSKGNKVMGIVVGGALSNLVRADKYLTFPIPNNWSLEDAATVPVVYLTVVYALNRVSLNSAKSILIHAGSGGIGQAAINLCHFYGLEIFTTVGTDQKRDFIRNTFPFIKANHIGNSRDTTFEQTIMRETHGRGVDLVLNSLAEEKLQASLRCLARGGMFLEIGKFDLMNESTLGLSLFRRETAFCGVHLDRIFRADASTKRRVIKLLSDAIAAGAVKPLPRKVYGVDGVEEAFRFMASGGHVGKMLIKMKEERPTAIAKYYFDGEGCCVIAGGLGGFGLELVDWLAKRGARKFVLSSRSGIKSGYQALRIKSWKSEGIQILICREDITTKDGCKALLKKATSLGPVVAIFNLAVILADALLENQTEDNFKKSLAPKAFATQYLDELSRTICPNLKDFVVFSSVSCGRGNAGQTNYGAANSIMERICEERRKVGLPGLAVQWGAVGDVGLVAEMQTEDVLLEIGGTLQQRISSCLQVLDQLLTQKDEAVVSSMVVAEKRSASGRADNIVDAVANIIGVRDIKTISHHSTLPELGMDSMMATEIKQTMEREFEIFMTVKDVRNLTFAKLHEIMSAKATAEMQNSDDAYKTFVKSVGTRESAKELLTSLPSAVTAQDEAPSVILFPGIEGVAVPMGLIAKNLAAHVYCAQFCCESFTEVLVGDMVEKLLPLIEAKAGANFKLVGYSFGSLLAVETVAALERKGLRGTLFLIDGAPRATVRLAEQQIGGKNDDEIQLKMLETIVDNYLSTTEIAALMANLSSLQSQEAREDAFLSSLSLTATENTSYYRNLMKQVQNRTTAVMDYKPTFTQIHSKVVLFKPTEQSVQGEAEDYGLSEVASDVTVHTIVGNHATILKSDEISEIISKEFL